MLLPVVIAIALANAHALTIDESTIDFGEKYQFAEVDRDVRVWNETQVPIRLSAIMSPVGWPVLTFDNALLKPGTSTLIHITLPLANHIGVLNARLPFNSESAGKTETHEIVATGYVDSILDEPRPALDLGVIDAKAPIEKSVQITSTKEPDLHVTRVLEKPDFLSARIGENHTLYVTPSKLDALGYSKGLVKVALDSKLQAQAWVTVLMDVHGDVSPDQNPLDFGVQRQSSRRPIRLQLRNRNGRAFHVGKVKVDPASVTVEATTCLQVSESCHAYLLTINPDHAYGQVAGKVGFELPDTHQVLNVHLGGIYLSDNTKVRSLDEPADTSDAPAAQSEAPRTVDLKQSLKKAVEDKTSTTPPGEGPLLKWQIANEAAIYGYAIYRGDSADGHFVRVNDAIIKAENGGDGTTANYQWRDTTVQKGREYWYYITIFNNNGTKTQLTGPQKVVAK